MQLFGRTIESLSQVDRFLKGAVNDRNAVGAIAMQILNGQLTHLTGPKNQDILAVQASEDFFCKLDCRIADGNGIGIDFGFRMSFFS
ncbi:Uncharacterised protein [Chlamydia trachomatis]|nr:Uncharacterised protein [Chlamydia trachomatis]